MQATVCLDELSEKEENLLDKTAPPIGPLKGAIVGVIVFFTVKYLFRKMKKVFESREYETTTYSEAEARSIYNKFKEFIALNETLQDRLIKSLKVCPQPFLKLALRKLNALNDYVHEKIEDFEFALNPQFINTMEKIVKGIDESNFDISKVKRVDSIS